MRYFRLAAVVFLLAGQSPALAQSSTDLVRANPRAQYALLKDVNARTPYRLPGRPDPRQEYDIALCGDEAALTADELTGRLAYLARQVDKASFMLQWADYPRSIWQPLLADYERTALDAAVNGLSSDNDGTSRIKELLTQRLEAQRRTSGNRLPHVKWLGCAGGGVELKIKTIPSGGDVWVILEFWHDLCGKQQLDADDRNQCNHGMDFADGDETELLGSYRYVVTWSNGRQRKGRQEFDDNWKNPTWTIRYSGP